MTTGAGAGRLGCGGFGERVGDGLGCLDPGFGLDGGDVDGGRRLGLGHVADGAGLDARDFDVALGAEALHLDFAVKGGGLFPLAGVVVLAALWAEHHALLARLLYGHWVLSLPCLATM